MGKGDDASAAPWAVPGVGVSSLDLVAEVGALAQRFAEVAPHASAAARLTSMRQLIDQMEAAWLVAAADFDHAGGPLDQGAVTLAGWLRHACKLAPAEASSRARVAEAITVGSLQRELRCGPGGSRGGTRR